jgi:hypothetical protein
MKIGRKRQSSVKAKHHQHDCGAESDFEIKDKVKVGLILTQFLDMTSSPGYIVNILPYLFMEKEQRMGALFVVNECIFVTCSLLMFVVHGQARLNVNPSISGQSEHEEILVAVANISSSISFLMMLLGTVSSFMACLACQDSEGGSSTVVVYNVAAFATFPLFMWFVGTHLILLTVILEVWHKSTHFRVEPIIISAALGVLYFIFVEMYFFLMTKNWPLVLWHFPWWNKLAFPCFFCRPGKVRELKRRAVEQAARLRKVTAISDVHTADIQRAKTLV